jgi:hypothetical protein
MSFKVAIISPNKIVYFGDNKSISKLTTEKIDDDIFEFISFKETKQEILMDTIVEALRLPELGNNIHPETRSCYEDDKYLYQICYISAPVGIEENINNISMQLVDNITNIVGDAVLIKHRIKEDRTAVCESITMWNIVNILQNRLIHNCVEIDTSGNINNIKFIYSPVEWKKVDEIKNIRYNEIQVFDSVLMFFIELNPISNEINELASIMFNKNILGSVVVALRKNTDEASHRRFDFIDICDKDIAKLVKVIFGYNYDRKETQNTDKIKNFYTSLVDDYYKYKDIDYDIKKINKNTKTVNEELREKFLKTDIEEETINE